MCRELSVVPKVVAYTTYFQLGELVLCLLNSCNLLFLFISISAYPKIHEDIFNDAYFRSKR